MKLTAKQYSLVKREAAQLMETYKQVQYITAINKTRRKRTIG